MVLLISSIIISQHKGMRGKGGGSSGRWSLRRTAIIRTTNSRTWQVRADPRNGVMVMGVQEDSWAKAGAQTSNFKQVHWFKEWLEYSIQISDSESLKFKDAEAEWSMYLAIQMVNNLCLCIPVFNPEWIRASLSDSLPYIFCFARNVVGASSVVCCLVRNC